MRAFTTIQAIRIWVLFQFKFQESFFFFTMAQQPPVGQGHLIV